MTRDAVDVGGDLTVEEGLLSGLDHARQYQRYIDGPSGCDRAMGPFSAVILPIQRR